MKILLDTCVWGGARAVLQAAGHEIEWVGDWPKDPGDEEILRIARRSGSVLVTLDKDFGELAVVRKMKHCGVIRLVGFRAREQGPACRAALAAYAEELEAGAMLTVDRKRVRVRPPEKDARA